MVVYKGRKEKGQKFVKYCRNVCRRLQWWLFIPLLAFQPIVVILFWIGSVSV
jgi:hypothetical protein